MIRPLIATVALGGLGIPCRRGGLRQGRVHAFVQALGDRIATPPGHGHLPWRVERDREADRLQRCRRVDALAELQHEVGPLLLRGHTQRALGHGHGGQAP